MLDVDVQHGDQVPLAEDEQAVGALAPYLADPALRLGSRAGRSWAVRSTVMPAAAKTVSNTVVNLASRSRISNRKPATGSSRSLGRFRACRATRRVTPSTGSGR